jgi:hypothetical protein
MAGALSSGAVSAVAVDTALRRLFVNRMKTGEFDPAGQQPYRQIPAAAANSKQHQALALQASADGLTLLKNLPVADSDYSGDDGRSQRAVLPLSVAKVKSVAVIGPNANCTQGVYPHGRGGDHHCNQLGNYATQPPFVISPADGFAQFAAVSGCEGSNISTAGGPPTAADKRQFGQAAAQAAAADAAVLVVGTLVNRQAGPQFGNSCCEGEGNDRPGVGIPPIQAALVDVVAAATAAAKKTLVVVVMSGGFLDLSPWKADSRVGAMLWVGYPGQMGGQAIAETIFGKVAPSGRLPYSIMTDQAVRSVNPMRMDMRPDGDYPGRTYRFSATPPVYAFGAGMSYTSWSYQWVGAGGEGTANVGGGSDDNACGTTAQQQRRTVVEGYVGGFRSQQSRMLAAIAGAQVLHNRVNVTNTGAVDSAVSVLAFSTPPGAGVGGVPLRQLFGFEKVFLSAAESTSVFFPMAARDLTVVGGGGDRRAATGTWGITAGVDGAEPHAITKEVCV